MTEQEVQSEFAIQKIYTKDLSFEAPNAPEVFQNEWKPELNINLQTTSKALDKENYEVVIQLTATVKNNEKVAFLVEAHEAGIFTLKDFPEDQMGPILGSVCPSIIFPYIREVVSDIVVRGGFPQLNLAPINFDALYAQQQQANQEAAAKEGDSEAGGESVH